MLERVENSLDFTTFLLFESHNHGLEELPLIIRIYRFQEFSHLVGICFANLEPNNLTKHNDGFCHFYFFQQNVEILIRFSHKNFS